MGAGSFKRVLGGAPTLVPTIRQHFARAKTDLPRWHHGLGD
jgi:hypothetical protein